VHFALLIVGASIGMVLYFLYLTDWRPFVLTGVLSVLYCLPLILHLDQRFWKRIGFLKPVILASVWACATAWWPLIEIGHVENSILLPVCVIRFSLVLMLNIIFDVGDVVQDKQKQISSVATSCSVWIIHVWMVAATLLYLIFTHHFFRLNAEPLQMYAQLLWVVPVLLLYVLSFKVRNYYFYYAITDGMLLLTVLITFLTRNV
jgi:4-hydroxybenzoate polyprenyltransferase